MAHLIDLKNRQPQESNPQDVQKPIMQHGTSVFSWSEQLHQQPNTRAVFFAAMLLFTIGALVQIFQKNLITTIFFAMLGIVILLSANKKQGESKFEISPIGIKINDNVLNYGGLKSFWIEYDPTLGIKELSIQTKKWHMPYIKIPIDEQNPVQLRLILLEFLPEVEHKDTLVEILSRKLGL